MEHLEERIGRLSSDRRKLVEENKNWLEQNKIMATALQGLKKKNAELEGGKKEAEESCKAAVEEARKGKKVAEAQAQSAREEADRAKKELDEGLARFNGLVAQERGKVAGLEIREQELGQKVSEMEQQIRRMGDDYVKLQEQCVEELSVCINNAKLEALWGVQLCFGPLSLGQAYALDVPPAPAGVDVLEVTDPGMLARVREELGFGEGGASVPSTPMVEDAAVGEETDRIMEEVAGGAPVSSLGESATVAPGGVTADMASVPPSGGVSTSSLGGVIEVAPPSAPTVVVVSESPPVAISAVGVGERDVGKGGAP